MNTLTLTDTVLISGGPCANTGVAHRAMAIGSGELSDGRTITARRTSPLKGAPVYEVFINGEAVEGEYSHSAVPELAGIVVLC